MVVANIPVTKVDDTWNGVKEISSLIAVGKMEDMSVQSIYFETNNTPEAEVGCKGSAVECIPTLLGGVKAV